MAAGTRPPALGALDIQKAPPVPDEELVARVLAGDQGSFGVLVARYQDRLVSFLFRMLRDLDTAHDLAQEVFLRVYQALDRFDPQFKFSTWTFRVAHNLGVDELRRRKVRWVPLQRQDAEDDSPWERELPSLEPSPYHDLRNDQRGAAIQQAIDALPGDYRELIVMRHYAELSYEEIAQLKRMPLGTVKNKLFRGRQMLKEKLAAYLGD
ncbi:MAG TPA: sigma-70 family RNA polymerase sigma factor [Thermoanaerobaculia bacterium]|jgi:RNA polymerase sigma-70 factor (ECF subfamily)|nr:sigma-70 family RNA polymerase sigma factor [Thermoanaerobaculia bacterium]